MSSTNKKPRILVLDLESLPNITYAYDLFSYIKPDMIIQERAIITFAYKWYGEKATYVLKGSASDPYNDKELVQEINNVLAEADYVVAHFGDKFDIPYIRARALINGLEPTPLVTSIDTYKLVKKHFNLNAKRLDYLGKILGLGRKIHTNWSLWERCAKGEKKAIDEMATYNKQDVVLLEKVFKALLPHVDTKLNLGLHVEGIVCPHCGSNQHQKRGYLFNKVSVRQRFQCLKCKSWFSTTMKKAEG